MSYKKLLLVAIMFLFPITVNADSLKLTDTIINLTETSSRYTIVTTNYDNEKKPTGLIMFGTYKTSEYSNNNYLMIKILDQNNKLIKKYSESEILEDGDFKDGFGIVNTEQDNIILNKTPKGNSDAIITTGDDQTENYKWIRQFGGNGMDMFYIAIKSYDKEKNDGYIVFGTTTSTDLNELKPGIFILKYDLNGEIIWQENIIQSQVIESYTNEIMDGIITVENDLIKLDYNFLPKFNIKGSNGGYLGVTHSRDINGKINGYVATTNTCNTILYRKNDIQNRTIELINKTTKYKPKMELLMTCDHFAKIEKFDLNGNKITEKVYNELNDAQFNTIIESQDSTGKLDGYIILGAIKKSETNYKTNGLFLKLDKDFNIIQKEIYEGGEYQNQLYGITKNYNKQGKFNGYNIYGEHSCYALEQNSTNNNGTIQPMKTDRNICNGNTSAVLLKYTYPEYEIKKNIDNGGTVTIDETAMAGSVVYMKINLEPGYELKEVIVTDEKGNKIEVKNNSFIMPEGKVNIEVKFKRLINPNTVSTLSVIVLLIMMTGMGISITKKKTQV